MEFKQVLESRSSVRTFKSEKIKKEDLREMARLAALAPSVNNYQPWKFIVITDKLFLQKMAQIVSEKISGLPSNNSQSASNIISQVEWFATFFREAPALIAIIMDKFETVLEKSVTLSPEEINRMRNFPDMQSAGACIQNMLLAATDMGYGACWLSAPMMAKAELEKIMEIQKSSSLIAFVAVGKPLNQPKPKNRKNIDEILIWKE
jgi:nitroreductase